MKVIFLDVDGVLNTPKLIKKFGYDHVDDVLVALLARVVRETGARIVLSSTWRVNEKDRVLVERALAQHGLELFGSTPVLKKDFPDWVQRHEEIRAWLEGEEVEKFAILDDWEDAGIEGSFFLTDENQGLTAEIAEKVIVHLS